MSADPGPEILQVEVGPIQNFVEILLCPARRRCVLVDPAFEVDRLYRLLAGRGVEVAAVLLTHGHPDHIEGVPEVLRRSGDVPVYIGEAEAGEVALLCQGEGVPVQLHPLRGGERLALGGLELHVLPTPGHTASGRSYHLPALGAVLTGDTLFVGGCGRTSFPGSDPRALFRSLQLLAALPEETRIYPGHDYGTTPTSTVGWELAHNRYLRCPDEQTFVKMLSRS